MRQENFFSSLNISKQCRKYALPLWQCPQFLFLILGFVVIASSLVTYFIGSRYTDDPEVIVLIVLAVTAFLIVIDFTITRSFEKLAEVARMKSEFISIVSHQLRSPLANLRWAADLLASGRLEEKEKEESYLQLLRENSCRMEELVNDLLVVSRIEMGEVSLKKESVSLKELTEKVLSRFSPLISASNIEMRFSAPADLPLAFVDPSQITLVIENLLDNAIRYIPSRQAEGGLSREKGKIEIRLGLKNNQFSFELKDNGIGIPGDDQKYIFQKFFRGDNAFKQQTQGSGLGLYIAKLIVEKSGGRIGFASRPGRGTSFWFTLPLKQ